MCVCVCVCAARTHLSMYGQRFALLCRALQGLPPTRVVLPSCVAKAAENLLEAHRALDGSAMPCDITPCQVTSSGLLTARHPWAMSLRSDTSTRQRDVVWMPMRCGKSYGPFDEMVPACHRNCFRQTPVEHQYFKTSCTNSLCILTCHVPPKDSWMHFLEPGIQVGLHSCLLRNEVACSALGFCTISVYGDCKHCIRPLDNLKGGLCWQPGDELALMNKLICRPFQTFHPVPSQVRLSDRKALHNHAGHASAINQADLVTQSQQGSACQSCAPSIQD